MTAEVVRPIQMNRYVQGAFPMTKLTLSAEPEVIAEAHRLAELHGTSVSAMFSRMIRLLSRLQGERPRIGPGARKASGLLRLPEGKSDRDVLEEALAEKYEL
jgi:hypothetical protein